MQSSFFYSKMRSHTCLALLTVALIFVSLVRKPPVISPVVSPVLNSQPNVKLDRFGGVDFVNSYRPLAYEKNASVSYAMGSDDLDAHRTCYLPGREVIYYRVNGNGFGSDFLNRANYMLWAAATPHLLLMHAACDYDTYQFYPYTRFVERHFMFLSGNLSCTKVGPAEPFNWERKHVSHWPNMTAWINREHGTKEIAVNKALILRRTMRMHPASRRALDARMPPIPRVAIHIRRTDKFSEATPVASYAYLVALHQLTAATTNVTVMSDDPSVKGELGAANYRITTTRPDMTKDANEAEEAFWNVLVDLRIMVEADIFIGTQSSNLGILACMLRGYNKCYSVESKDLEWDPLKDKAS